MVTLAVANLGGHLRQLVELLPRLEVDDRVIWVTNDGAQSRSLLRGQEVLWLAYPRARSLADGLANARRAHRVVRDLRPRQAVSTGSSLAVSVLPLVAAYGGEVHYIESATRTDGPSLSGRMLRAVPGIHLYAQSESWADGAWHYRGNVFEGYEVHEEGTRSLRRVVVSVGTSSFGGFRRLIERMIELLPADAEVLWQTGGTDTSGLPIDARPSVPASELEAAIREADLVVSHAGTGSALTALANGKLPVLVPRDPEHGEHVDRHQFQIAAWLERSGLAATAPVASLDQDLLRRAAATRVSKDANARMFRLGDRG